MENDRQVRTYQQQLLFENILAQEALAASKIEEYKKYLRISGENAKSGMTNEEIDMVYHRAQVAAEKL